MLKNTRRRENSMATRLLLLLVVIMLVFAVLYGCAQASSPAERQEHRADTQEAAKDRQPMKRVEEPTTAETAPHAPKESDDRVRRAKAGVVVRAGKTAVVARAGDAVVRVGGSKTAKGEGTDATALSREVTLKVEGSPEKVVFSAGDHTNSDQQTSTQGGTITLWYGNHGSTGLVSSSTYGSGNQANSSSQVSVLQSNSTSERGSR
jgi:hypothetical protein